MRYVAPGMVLLFLLALQKNGDLCNCGMMNRVITVEIANEASIIVI